MNSVYDKHLDFQEVESFIYDEQIGRLYFVAQGYLYKSDDFLSIQLIERLPIYTEFVDGDKLLLIDSHTIAVVNWVYTLMLDLENTTQRGETLTAEYTGDLSIALFACDDEQVQLVLPGDETTQTPDLQYTSTTHLQYFQQKMPVKAQPLTANDIPAQLSNQCDLSIMNTLTIDQMLYGVPTAIHYMPRRIKTQQEETDSAMECVTYSDLIALIEASDDLTFADRLISGAIIGWNETLMENIIGQFIVQSGGNYHFTDQELIQLLNRTLAASETRRPMIDRDQEKPGIISVDAILSTATGLDENGYQYRAPLLFSTSDQPQIAAWLDVLYITAECRNTSTAIRCIEYVVNHYREGFKFMLQPSNLETAASIKQATEVASNTDRQILLEASRFCEETDDRIDYPLYTVGSSWRIQEIDCELEQLSIESVPLISAEAIEQYQGLFKNFAYDCPLLREANTSSDYLGYLASRVFNKDMQIDELLRKVENMLIKE